VVGRRVGRAGLTGILVTVAGVVLLAPAVGAKPEKRGRTVELDVRDNEYDPEVLRVRKGTVVKFVNVGRNDHNVLPSDEDDEFLHIPTSRLEPDESAGIQLSTPGKYRYYCSLHGTRAAGMRGVITVKA
jgi:plastocyanin